MQSFVYEYATKVYFGEGAAREHLAQAVSGFGQNVLLAYCLLYTSPSPRDS